MTLYGVTRPQWVKHIKAWMVDILQAIFSNAHSGMKNSCILIPIGLFISKGQSVIIGSGNATKPLPETKLTKMWHHMVVTGPQWINMPRIYNTYSMYVLKKNSINDILPGLRKQLDILQWNCFVTTHTVNMYCAVNIGPILAQFCHINVCIQGSFFFFTK